MNQSRHTWSLDSTKRPPTFVVVMFFLLFSGPPSLRLRDPGDSLDSVIDPTVIVQSLVWVVAGIWTLFQLRKDSRRGCPMWMGGPDKLGILMILFLGLSTWVSEAPLLTAFKVGQMLVCLLFTWMFIYRYGVARCLHYVFLGSVALCLAIAVSAFAAPDLVFFLDDGVMRLRGDPIAVMGTVGTYSTILLFLKHQQIPRWMFWSLLAVLSTLLALSLTRQAWFLVSASVFLYFSRRSKGAFLRWIGFAFLLVFPFVFVYYILPALQEYRATDTIWSLTGRTDLWVYLVQVAFARSAWTGLGYYSASRILALDFNSGMGTAHSIFVEVLLGGGLLSLIPCMVLCIWLARQAFRFLSKNRTDLEFACGTIFLVTLAIGLLGGDFASGEIGITFWSLAAALPAMSRHRVAAHPIAPISNHPESPLRLRTNPLHT